MIGTIARKELTEFRRDGRMIAIAGLIALLVLVSLVTGWSTHAEQRQQAHRAQQKDQATFADQGRKPPHSAAHFGRMAYKPVSPLAVFDPGVAPYLGQAIWLEAHTRNPAMFRPAEDAPELRRLADLSIAGILTLLLPLLVFLAGHGAFAAERERGTLRQVMCSGPGIGRLFAGKIAVAAGIGVVASLAAVAAAVALALQVPGDVSAGDALVRAAGLVLGYGHYSLACAAVALYVSARARDAASALLVLLGIWAICVVILPRVAATAAEHVHPTPNSQVFWAEASRAIRAGQPARGSEAYKSVERQVLGRALGRRITDEEAAAQAVNRVAVRMEVSEVLGAKAYADVYRDLYATYGKQQRLRRLISILSPAIVLRHLSSTLSGTDIAAHRHFSLEAERQRNAVIRAMNENMMLKGAGQGFDYLVDPDFWASVPDFAYRPPPTSFALRSALWDLLVLQLWSLAACWLAWRAARRQQVI